MSQAPYPPDPSDHPRKIAITKETLKDSSRNDREVPVKFIYPQAEKSEIFPVILWSHGLGGSRDGAGFVGRYLAANGYIVVNVQHPGTDNALWEGKPGHPWDHIRASHISRKVTLERFRDIPFVLNSLEAMAENYPQIGKYIDLNSIGMSGHSFGAITTQIMAGQSLGRGRRKYRLADPRIRAAIAYSPSVTYNHDEPPEEIYGPIDRPMLYMTGTKDVSPVSGADYRYRLDIFNHAGGPDQYMLVLNEADHMVFAGSRGKLGAAANRKSHEERIKLFALIFWNAYLKKDEQARKYLQSLKVKEILSSSDDFKMRNLD